MPTQINLAKRIKIFRMAKEITQGECAVLLGVSKPTLQRLESGIAGSDLTRAKVLNRLQNLSDRNSVAA